MRRYLDRRLKLQMLRAADAIEAHGSILKAAAALGMSQPALTKSLQELEDIVRARLFDRHSRGVRVTEAGARLVLAGRKILTELARLDEDLDVLGMPDGGVAVVGALPVAATGVLPIVLARLGRVHPHLHVRLQQGRTEELLPALVSGELDLIAGRLYEPAVPDGLVREPLWSEPLSLLARADHPVFEIEHPSPDDLGRYPLTLPTITQRVGQEIEHLLSLLGLNSVAALRSNSYSFIREMMLGTDALSVMPRLMMAGDLLRGTIRIVPLPVRTPDRPAGLILRARELSPAASAFVASLRDSIIEIAEGGFVASGWAEPPDPGAV